MKHYIWRSGLIETGKTVPDGAILLGEGQDVADKINAVSRHMYDDTLRAGSVYDALLREKATNPQDREMATALCIHPEDTPEEALDRWLKWTKLG